MKVFKLILEKKYTKLQLHSLKTVFIKARKLG